VTWTGVRDPEGDVLPVAPPQAAKTSTNNKVLMTKSTRFFIFTFLSLLSYSIEAPP
jgi:hypothetical protein